MSAVAEAPDAEALEADPVGLVPCLPCDGLGVMGEIIALGDGWEAEVPPFVPCPECSGTGAGWEIGGSG